MNPREKVWGVIVSLRPEGVTLRGINLESFDDFLRQILRQVDAQTAMTTAFYPMHRVERIASDDPSVGIPSLSAIFREKVGLSLLEFLRTEVRNREQ